MKPAHALRPAPLVLLLALCALFYACGKAGSPAGPADPDPNDSCLADSTLCLPPQDSCLADSTLCPPPQDSCLADSTLCAPPEDSCTADSTLCPEPEPDPPGPRNCAADPVVFTEYVMDPALLKVVAQIGSIGGGNTELVGRSYVFPKDGQQGTRLPIRAPADLEVVAAKHYLPTGTPSGYVPDWSMYLDAGCGITLELYHVKDVSDSIKAAADTAVYPSSAWEQLSRRVPMKAGDTIGWYIPGPSSVAWDFIARNDSVTNQFANQDRYVTRRSNILHVVCPYDLFEPAKKDAYYDLLGSVTGVPVEGASCGTVERDVIGTPAGQWFFDSAFTPVATLEKVGDYGSPFPNIIAPDSTLMFGHIGPTNDFRIQRDNPTWKRPQDITGGWCYQRYPTPTTPDGWLWLQMITPAKMHAAYGDSGLCPASFPDSGYRAYYR